MRLEGLDPNTELDGCVVKEIARIENARDRISLEVPGKRKMRVDQDAAKRFVCASLRPNQMQSVNDRDDRLVARKLLGLDRTQ